MIIAGADNRPPMLAKSMYDSWKSRIELYIENRENGRMILNSVQHGPLGLPPDVYVIVNHHKVAKEIWDRVKLLMQGTQLSLQEKECKLYDEFDKFSFVKGETLYQYYKRFFQLINNMNVINMSMRLVQLNTKFLNSLPPEWSKFITDVKLARDLHTTDYDQLYSYLEQHEAHANKTRLMRERYQYPLAFVANFNQPQSHITNYHSPSNSTQFPQPTNTLIPQVHSPQSYSPMKEAPHLSQPQISITVPGFTQGDDPITCLNKAMAFLSAVAASRFPSANNQLRTSSNLRNQATIQDGRGNATSSGGNNVGGQTRVVKCYICQGEGHMARQCTQPKRPRNAEWFKDKVMLAESQVSSQILDEEWKLISKKRTKNRSQKRQNRARERKERQLKKSKSTLVDLERALKTELEILNCQKWPT
ncbi:reverse transcriptase domain, reverse transcriptase zinc-binding domain protein, partial [Tanacetum coccineum]